MAGGGGGSINAGDKSNQISGKGKENEHGDAIASSSQCRDDDNGARDGSVAGRRAGQNAASADRRAVAAPTGRGAAEDAARQNDPPADDGVSYAWSYGRAYHGGFKCNYCGLAVKSGGVTRLKVHLAGVKGDM